MPNPFTIQPGVEQGDIGPRYVRKRLADEYYEARYCKAGDRIQIVATLATGVIAALTSVNLTIGGRVQGMDGQLSSFSDSFTFTADGAQTARYIPMPEGYITHFVALSTTDGLDIGDMAVVVTLVQGFESAPTPVDLITAGWVSNIYLLGLNTVQATV